MHGADRQPGEIELLWLQRLYPGGQWDDPPHASFQTRLPFTPPVLGLVKPYTNIVQGIVVLEEPSLGTSW